MWASFCRDYDKAIYCDRPKVERTDTFAKLYLTFQLTSCRLNKKVRDKFSLRQRRLCFVSLDTKQMRSAVWRLSDGVRRAVSEKSREESDGVYGLFCDLAGVHIYFKLLRSDGTFRLDRAR